MCAQSKNDNAFLKMIDTIAIVVNVKIVKRYLREQLFIKAKYLFEK